MATDATADNAIALMILGWILFAISSIVVGLRVYTRLTRVHRVAIDDYLILIAWFSEVLHIVFLTVAWTKGLGRHFDTLTAAQQQAALLWTIGVVELFSVIACMWGRMSFATFLLYIIGPTDPKKRFALWSVIAIQIIVNLVVLVQIYAQCGIHVTALWNYVVAAHTTCQSLMVETLIGYVQSGFNSLCDVCLTILPALILWKLNMPLGQKLGLGATLTLSIFAFGASLAKAVEIRNLSMANDFTWYFTSLQLWVCVENNVVMIAASIPTLRPLLRRKSGSTATPVPYAWSSSQSRRKASAHDPYEAHVENVAHSGRDIRDDDSEEHILQALPTAADQITKTTAFHVKYEVRSDLAEGAQDIEHGGTLPGSTWRSPYE